MNILYLITHSWQTEINERKNLHWPFQINQESRNSTLHYISHFPLLSGTLKYFMKALRFFLKSPEKTEGTSK